MHYTKANAEQKNKIKTIQIEKRKKKSVSVTQSLASLLNNILLSKKVCFEEKNALVPNNY